MPRMCFHPYDLVAWILSLEMELKDMWPSFMELTLLSCKNLGLRPRGLAGCRTTRMHIQCLPLRSLGQLVATVFSSLEVEDRLRFKTISLWVTRTAWSQASRLLTRIPALTPEPPAHVCLCACVYPNVGGVHRDSSIPSRKTSLTGSTVSLLATANSLGPG